jgi:uncharacterized protein YjdB
VINNGRVKIIGTGTCTIKATSMDGGASDQCVITVKDTKTDKADFPIFYIAAIIAGFVLVSIAVVIVVIIRKKKLK